MSNAGRQLNRLTLDLMLRLTDYIRANYVQSDMDDVAFAKRATEALGFPIEQKNVETARKAVGLPSRHAAHAKAAAEKRAARARAAAEKRAAKPSLSKKMSGEVVTLTQVLDEMHALNLQMITIIKRLDVYFGGK